MIFFFQRFSPKNLFGLPPGTSWIWTSRPGAAPAPLAAPCAPWPVRSPPGHRGRRRGPRPGDHRPARRGSRGERRRMCGQGCRWPNKSWSFLWFSMVFWLFVAKTWEEKRQRIWWFVSLNLSVTFCWGDLSKTQWWTRYHHGGDVSCSDFGCTQHGRCDCSHWWFGSSLCRVWGNLVKLIAGIVFCQIFLTGYFDLILIWGISLFDLWHLIGHLIWSDFVAQTSRLAALTPTSNITELPTFSTCICLPWCFAMIPHRLFTIYCMVLVHMNLQPPFSALRRMADSLMTHLTLQRNPWNLMTSSAFPRRLNFLGCSSKWTPSARHSSCVGTIETRFAII